MNNTRMRLAVQWLADKQLLINWMSGERTGRINMLESGTVTRFDEPASIICLTNWANHHARTGEDMLGIGVQREGDWRSVYIEFASMFNLDMT